MKQLIWISLLFIVSLLPSVAKGSDNTYLGSRNNIGMYLVNDKIHADKNHIYFHLIAVVKDTTMIYANINVNRHNGLVNSSAQLINMNSRSMISTKNDYLVDYILTSNEIPIDYGILQSLKLIHKKHPLW